VNRRDAKCSLPVELRNGIVVHGGAVVTLVRARKKIKKIDVWLRKERVKDHAAYDPMYIDHVSIVSLSHGHRRSVSRTVVSTVSSTTYS
jgi:hypothetical protein